MEFMLMRSKPCPVKMENQPLSCIPFRQRNNLNSSHFLDSAYPVGDVSMADPKSNYNLSGHGVMGMTDFKLIFEFRRTMTQQQRIFSGQVFELHRLMKVQGMMARCPDLFAPEHKHYFHRKQPPKSCSDPEKKSQNNLEPLSSQTKGSFDLQIPKMNPYFKLHSLEHSSGFTQEPFEPLQSNSDSKSRPCAMNQWLVPVTSPSEGLIYKPYIGPCPPPTGSLAPVYCTPSNVDGVFVNMICGVPASNHVDNSICNSLYTLPSSRAEQNNNNQFARNWQCGPTQFSSDHDNNIVAIPDQSSRSVISQNNQNSINYNTIHGSCEKVQNVLPLFPTTPNIRVSNQPVTSRVDEPKPMQVIKAVPRNPKLASESTARILKRIQDERKCC